ncbi:hypothetical protein JCM18903_2255 [Psychrobacter sp. JCM 18903]|uniref:hypothetical protein n=1 Tax=Psychrobacter sp. JCM 18903 TaxID=1298610 RepID=UPI0004349B07|nr:hypothetical protein [Psychrobacter sp. JCM 18903]GAF62197.1 hypothetical protein JCM18903_2255 [Psychrobacter sp. JCM 18903]
MKNNVLRYRKIRGINRRKRTIEKWGEANKVLDVDLLNQEKRDYVKFLVAPWSRLSLINSIYPEPIGDCEYLLIKNVQNIYQSWKDSLEKLQTPYYLQIWLFETYISRSQVVCAIEDYKDFYQNTFEPIDEQPENGIQSSIHYNSKTAEYLDHFEWKLYRRLDYYDMADEEDVEMLQDIDPIRFLRKESIEGQEQQIVEIDKVWLIS